MTEWLSGALFMAGATLSLLAAVGVLRMPDVFTRMQASTKASTLGLGCLLAGLAIRHPDVSVAIRAGSIGAFMMLTTAVAAHVIARAAALTGAPLWTGTRIDERRPRAESPADRQHSHNHGQGNNSQHDEIAG
jgi:multicomponent Na+:H+ antiporter subunit G